MFTGELVRLWERLIGPIQVADGLTIATCDRAEVRLGLPLPAPLREFYRLLGRNRVAMRAHMRFRKPGNLEVVRGGLVFCEENQRVYFNSVRVRQLRQVAPPVVQGNDHEDRWYSDCRQITTFLLKSLCWQAVSALPASGFAHVAKSALQKAVDGLVPVGDTGSYNNEIRAYVGDGLVVCTFSKNGVLYAASQSEDGLRQFEMEAGVDLDRL